MDPVALLRKDHVTLREQLSLLERLLPLRHSDELPIREIVQALTRSLRCHMRQEAYLFTAVGARPTRRTHRLARSLRKVQSDQQDTLETLHEVLQDPVRARAARVRDLIDQLRTILLSEERELLRALDDVEGLAYDHSLVERLHEIAVRVHREDDPEIPPACEL